MAWTARMETDGTGGWVSIGDFVLWEKVTRRYIGENGEPDAVLTFEVRDGRPQCTDVHLSAKPGGRPLFTSDLQVLALDALTTHAYTLTSVKQSYDPETNVTTTQPVTDERELWVALAAIENAVKAPRRRVTPAELERVAQVYRENVDTAPVKAVQVHLGYDSERTAARRVEAAREAGLLPKTTRGKRKA